MTRRTTRITIRTERMIVYECRQVEFEITEPGQSILDGGMNPVWKTWDRFRTQMKDYGHRYLPGVRRPDEDTNQTKS